MPELPLHDQLIEAVAAELTGKDKQRITPKLKGLRVPDREAFMDLILQGTPSTGFGNFTPQEFAVVTGLATPALNRLTTKNSTSLTRGQVQTQWVVNLNGARSALKGLPHPQGGVFAEHLETLGDEAHAQIVALTKGRGQVDGGVRKAMGGAQKLIVECLRGFVI